MAKSRGWPVLEWDMHDGAAVDEVRRVMGSRGWEL